LRASPLRKAVPVVVTLAVLAALAAFLIRHRAHIAESYSLRPGAFLAIAALIAATLVLRSLAHQRLFGRLGVSASFRDWFALVTVSALSNYLPFSGGLLAKALYLKRVHDIPYRLFAVGQASLVLVIFATNGTVGLATLLLRLPESAAGVVGAAFALMIASGALVLIPERAGRRLGGQWFPWEATSAPEVRRAWPGVALLQVAVLLATAASLKLCFAMGSSDVPFAACLLFAASVVITRLVSITPGAIGIREFLIGGVAHLTGFDLRDAVIASTLSRSVEIAVVFGLGGAFTYSLTGKMASGNAQSAPEPPARLP
jgi:uncharacterized membrane protein YbhN (UPF0104 family)